MLRFREVALTEEKSLQVLTICKHVWGMRKLPLKVYAKRLQRQNKKTYMRYNLNLTHFNKTV